MQTAEIIEIISGKKTLTKQNLGEVKILMEKYPYFETLYNIHLRNIYKISPDAFQSELSKYSIYINDRKKMVGDVFAENEKIIKKLQSKKETKVEVKTDIKPDKNKNKVEALVKPKKEVKKKKVSRMDEDIFDPVLYEKQKIAHKKIVEDFVVPKAQKFGELRTGLKVENLTEEEFWQNLQDDVNSDNTDNRNTIIEGKTKKDKLERKKEDVEKINEKTIEEAKIDDSKNIDDTNKVEKADIIEEKIEKDDIFSKIAKLKSKKLLDLQNEELEATPEIIEEETKTDVVEEKIDVVKATPEIIEEETKTDVVEEKIDVVKATPKIIEEETKLVEEKIDVVKATPKIIEEETKLVEEKKLSAADRLLLKLKNKKLKSYSDKPKENIEKSKVSADDILKKLKGEKTTKETVEQKKEETFVFDETKTEIIDEKTEEVNDLVEINSENIKEEEKIETSDKKEVNANKTAADLVLEKIKSRNNETSGDHLIDKFLTDQPYIDRKKEPENTADLSIDSAKETEIITERLAEIYALQGLKTKAITTYEKLILKYPEKSSYFASKIKDLENK